MYYQLFLYTDPTYYIFLNSIFQQQIILEKLRFPDS